MIDKNKTNNLEKSWKLVNFCEFDKYAVKSYCAIHNVDESLNLGDITKVDETKLEDFNMIVGGSPCQDFSVAGKQKGSVWACKDCGHEYNPLTVHWSKRGKCPNCESENIEKTRSSLLVEFLRVVREKKPNFGIYENVKNIVGKQFRDTTFKLFEDELHEYGYNTYWNVLNSKDYGVPQNRERVYLIFIRKNLDNGKFVFPEEFDSGIRLKDVLEDEVDEKYYISDEKVQSFLKNLLDNKSLDNSTELRQLGYINDYNGDANRVYSDDCARTLKAEAGGGGAKTGLYVVNQIGIDKSLNDTKVIDNANCITAREDRGISNRKAEGTAVIEIPDISYCLDANYYKGTTPEQYVKKKRRQLVFENEVKKVGKTTTKSGKSHQKDDVISTNGISTTLLSTDYKQPKQICIEDINIRIRKLMPKECFRLMGFNDFAYEAASKVVSNSQLYKQAGNSIVVDVLYYIFVELYKAMPYLFNDLRLSSFFSGIGAFESALDRLYESINTGNFTNPQAE